MGLNENAQTVYEKLLFPLRELQKLNVMETFDIHQGKFRWKRDYVLPSIFFERRRSYGHFVLIVRYVQKVMSGCRFN